MTPADKARDGVVWMSKAEHERLPASAVVRISVDGEQLAETPVHPGSDLDVTTAGYLVDSPSGQCRDQTTAEEIAGRYGNDGQCWEIDDEHIGDVVYLARAWDYAEATRTRYEFADGSSIVLDHPEWSLGFTGRHLRCVCWPEVHPNHEEKCEEAESWNL